jgi:protein TonB
VRTRRHISARHDGKQRLLFSAELPADDGPSGRAAVISLALHAVATLALLVWVRFAVPAKFRPYEVTMLRETRLVDPLQYSAGPGHASALAAEAGRRQMPASHGATLPHSETYTPFPPLAITTAKPKLPVSSTIIDVPPPKIEENFRYGDLASVLVPVSTGAGIPGLGSGQAGSDGTGTQTGAGRKQAASSGPVFSLHEVTVAPLLLYKVEPDYSEQARLARYNGTVLLRVVIDEQGAPQDIRVLRSLGLGLDEKAIEAVRHWRFRPGLKNGKAVAVDANVEVNFQLL